MLMDRSGVKPVGSEPEGKGNRLPRWNDLWKLLPFKETATNRIADTTQVEGLTGAVVKGKGEGMRFPFFQNAQVKTRWADLHGNP